MAVVQITVMTEVVLFYGTLSSELSALGVVVCICMRQSKREREGALGLSL